MSQFTQCPLVAVVDDNPSIGKSVQRLLQSLGFRAHVFGSGAEFLHSLRLHVPDCVLASAGTDATPGIEWVDFVQRTDWRIPVILTAEDDDDRIVHHARTTGARGVLRKPFAIDELSTLLAETLGCQGYIAGRCPWPCPVIGHAVWNCAFSGFSEEARLRLNAALRA